MARRRVYPRPFPGLPSSLPMSGLFLLSPEVDMKLAGHPSQRLFKEIGKESLYKRINQQEKKETSAKRSITGELLALFPESPIIRLLEAATCGDAEARAQIDALESWEMLYFERCAVHGGAISAQAAFILEIERACKGPMRLVQEHRYDEALALLVEHPVMGQFLCPRARNLLTFAIEPFQLLPLRAFVAMEIRLSLVALADVVVSDQEGNSDRSSFSCLIPTEGTPPRNPTSLFFQWLKTEVGADTIKAFLNKDNSAAGTVDISTLKRWSSGSHQPSTAWLRALAKQLFDDARHAPLWDRYWAARYLNFIGYITETYIERAACLAEKMQFPLLPWPDLPFGCRDISSWMRTRYPVWLAYHRDRLGNPMTKDYQGGVGAWAIPPS